MTIWHTNQYMNAGIYLKLKYMPSNLQINKKINSAMLLLSRVVGASNKIRGLSIREKRKIKSKHLSFNTLFMAATTTYQQHATKITLDFDPCSIKIHSFRAFFFYCSLWFSVIFFFVSFLHANFYWNCWATNYFLKNKIHWICGKIHLVV